jgi:hypothetical protein
MAVISGYIKINMIAVKAASKAKALREANELTS